MKIQIYCLVFLAFALVTAVSFALTAKAQQRPDTVICYACQNHICVNQGDCPAGCACARRPWEPQGECV